MKTIRIIANYVLHFASDYGKTVATSKDPMWVYGVDPIAPIGGF